MKLTAKHIKAVKVLIERYNNLTLAEIEKVALLCSAKASLFPSYLIVMELTGFGWKTSCTLCISVKGQCKNCIHSTFDDDGNQYHLGCLDHKTYQAIAYAKNAEQLLEAYQARAKYLQLLLDRYELS